MPVAEVCTEPLVQGYEERLLRPSRSGAHPLARAWAICESWDGLLELSNVGTMVNTVSPFILPFGAGPYTHERNKIHSTAEKKKAKQTTEETVAGGSGISNFPERYRRWETAAMRPFA
jgi:hypothetical protein